MKYVGCFLLAVVLGAPAWGQQRVSSGFGNILFPGSPGGPRPTSPGFGSVLFPGGRPSPFSDPHSSFAQRLSSTVTGQPGYTGAPTRFGRRGGFGFGGVVPIGVPVGFGFGNAFGAYPPEPPVTIIQQPPPPPVIINQTFVTNPREPEPPIDAVSIYRAPSRYSERENPEPAASAVTTPKIYLLAFKNGSVYSAVGYWVDGETLHYITPSNEHNQVSLALVDRATTDAINRDRNVKVALPQE
jgi:hypothetical protein